MRFRPEQHLRRQSEIRAIREKGRKVDCGAFTLWWYARPSVEGQAPLGPRVCVVASTAAVGNAICRNLAKRRFREVFRLHQDKIPSTLDLMLLGRSAVNKLEFSELEKRFLQALTRLPSPIKNG